MNFLINFQSKLSYLRIFNVSSHSSTIHHNNSFRRSRKLIQLVKSLECVQHMTKRLGQDNQTVTSSCLFVSFFYRIRGTVLFGLEENDQNVSSVLVVGFESRNLEISKPRNPGNWNFLGILSQCE
jgi:hypothetical protein